MSSDAERVWRRAAQEEEEDVEGPIDADPLSSSSSGGEDEDEEGVVQFVEYDEHDDVGGRDEEGSSSARTDTKKKKKKKKQLWEMTRGELSQEWAAWARDKYTANRWHDRRRAKILKAHPEIAQLFGAEPLTPCLTLALAALHVYIAIYWTAGSVLLACLLAATVGGLISFDLQALNHELMHQYISVRDSRAYDKGSIAKTITRRAFEVLCGRACSHLAGLMGSMCTAIPWFAYYFAGGHEFHHAHAGTPYDNDGDALFWAWESVPRQLPMLNTPVGSVVWISLVSLVLPVIYFFSLGYWFIKCPVANAVEMMYATVDTGFTVALHWYVVSSAGWAGFTYLYLSSAFSMGFLFHPLLAFWVSQHWCKIDHLAPRPEAMLQPTLSYYGSKVWNWLTLNELLHVEHHDFSRIPWTRLQRLRDIAPEYYTAPRHVVLDHLWADLLTPWVTRKDLKFDFACRRAALEVPYNPFVRYASAFLGKDSPNSAATRSDSLRRRLKEDSESS